MVLCKGLTEFLPVSSSGHLKLAQYFLGLQDLDHYILFDLTCHLGTLLAIVIIFFSYIKDIFLGQWARLWQVTLGTLPLFPLLALMKPIKAAYADPSYLGIFFLMTAAILFLGVYLGKTLPEQQLRRHTWRDALIIGMWQALAILPGVSRSGSTISGARLLGWSAQEAVVFSFLLAIPAVAGGTILELYKWWQQPAIAADVALEHYFLGAFVSFVVGLAALRLLIVVATHNKFSYFAWYCLFLGLATTCYFRL